MKVYSWYSCGSFDFASLKFQFYRRQVSRHCSSQHVHGKKRLQFLIKSRKKTPHQHYWASLKRGAQPCTHLMASYPFPELQSASCSPDSVPSTCRRVWHCQSPWSSERPLYASLGTGSCHWVAHGSSQAHLEMSEGWQWWVARRRQVTLESIKIMNRGENALSPLQTYLRLLYMSLKDKGLQKDRLITSQCLLNVKNTWWSIVISQQLAGLGHDFHQCPNVWHDSALQLVTTNKHKLWNVPNTELAFIFHAWPQFQSYRLSHAPDSWQSWVVPLSQPLCPDSLAMSRSFGSVVPQRRHCTSGWWSQRMCSGPGTV